MSDAIATVDLEQNANRQRNYESVYQSAADPWDYFSCADQVRFATIANCVRHWKPKPKRVLDVACGLGQLTQRMADCCDEVWAYDFAPSAVERTRRRCSGLPAGRVHVDVRDALNPGFENNFFDVILMCDVATDGNGEWWQRVLCKAIESLAPNGIIIVSGRIKKRCRPEFDSKLESVNGTIVERILFHDRYWYKFRSGIKRLFPASFARKIMANPIPFRCTQAIGKLHGPNGSIHYGVVVQFAKD